MSQRLSLRPALLRGTTAGGSGPAPSQTRLPLRIIGASCATCGANSLYYKARPALWRGLSAALRDACRPRRCARQTTCHTAVTRPLPAHLGGFRGGRKTPYFSGSYAGSQNLPEARPYVSGLKHGIEGAVVAARVGHLHIAAAAPRCPVLAARHNPLHRTGVVHPSKACSGARPTSPALAQPAKGLGADEMHRCNTAPAQLSRKRHCGYPC